MACHPPSDWLIQEKQANEVKAVILNLLALDLIINMESVLVSNLLTSEYQSRCSQGEVGLLVCTVDQYETGVSWKAVLCRLFEGRKGQRNIAICRNA